MLEELVDGLWLVWPFALAVVLGAGVILGWMIWGRVRPKMRRAQAEVSRIEAEFVHAQQMLAIKERRIAELEEGTVPSEASDIPEVPKVEPAAEADGLRAALDATRIELAERTEALDAARAEAREGADPRLRSEHLEAKADVNRLKGLLSGPENLGQANPNTDAQVRPLGLEAPRNGQGDDLTQIKGVGEKLAALCNSLGFYHFDQIAAWSEAEVAWVDANLEGFKGRVTRDDWVAQAKTLSEN